MTAWPARAKRHALEALRCLARLRCRRRSCGTACLCEPCHARAAMAIVDPSWRAR